MWHRSTVGLHMTFKYESHRTSYTRKSLKLLLRCSPCFAQTGVDPGADVSLLQNRCVTPKSHIRPMCFSSLKTETWMTGYYWGQKFLHYITLFKNIRLCNIFHYTTGFEFFPQFCNALCCCRVHHVDMGLHYMIVFKLIYWLCNLFLHYRIGSGLNM